MTSTDRLASTATVTRKLGQRNVFLFFVDIADIVPLLLRQIAPTVGWSRFKMSG